MDIEFIPKLRGGKDRTSTFDKFMFKIEESIKAKRRADLEAMSQEEKIDNHYTAILPDIPKTKKGIDKAIDSYIKEMTPETDNGEELLEYLGFYDIGEDIEEGDWTKRANYLRERIKFKEEGDTITILSSTKEVVDIVRELLRSLPTEELYNLCTFGIVVTEEEANKERESFIDQAKYWYMYKLYCYAEESYNSEATDTDTEEDILFKAGERDYKHNKDIFKEIYKDKTDQEYIKDHKERIIKAITDYPEEATAYCRAIRMIRNNYSERAILSTIDKILSNGTTTD